MSQGPFPDARGLSRKLKEPVLGVHDVLSGLGDVLAKRVDRLRVCCGSLKVSLDNHQSKGSGCTSR